MIEVTGIEVCEKEKRCSKNLSKKDLEHEQIKIFLEHDGARDRHVFYGEKIFLHKLNLCYNSHK